MVVLPAVEADEVVVLAVAVAAAAADGEVGVVVTVELFVASEAEAFVALGFTAEAVLLTLALLVAVVDVPSSSCFIPTFALVSCIFRGLPRGLRTTGWVSIQSSAPDRFIGQVLWLWPRALQAPQMNTGTGRELAEVLHVLALFSADPGVAILFTSMFPSSCSSLLPSSSLLSSSSSSCLSLFARRGRGTAHGGTRTFGLSGRGRRGQGAEPWLASPQFRQGLYRALSRMSKGHVIMLCPGFLPYLQEETEDGDSENAVEGHDVRRRDVTMFTALSRRSQPDGGGDPTTVNLTRGLRQEPSLNERMLISSDCSAARRQND